VLWWESGLDNPTLRSKGRVRFYDTIMLTTRGQGAKGLCRQRNDTLFMVVQPDNGAPDRWRRRSKMKTVPARQIRDKLGSATAELSCSQRAADITQSRPSRAAFLRRSAASGPIATARRPYSTAEKGFRRLARPNRDFVG